MREEHAARDDVLGEWWKVVESVKRRDQDGFSEEIVLMNGMEELAGSFNRLQVEAVVWSVAENVDRECRALDLVTPLYEHEQRQHLKLNRNSCAKLDVHTINKRATHGQIAEPAPP